MIDVVANTVNGKIRGVFDDGVYRFLGVRYAKPPVGDLRFQPPQPLDPWDVIVDAKQYSDKCWQTDTPQIEVPEIANSPYNKANQLLMAGNMELGKGPQTEDCLTLNIWTPELHRGEKLPVMVWCHGGGNVAGTGEAPWHDGTNMAKKNRVVMVTFSHRLGLLGYMDLTHLGDERFRDSVNLGNLDMVAVLEWVRDNIDWFGGDKDNVTVFGESGGGGKVAQLLGMPAAKGLFSKAIIQSGGFMAVAPEVAQADTDALLSHLGIGKKDLSRLLSILPEDLIKAEREINSMRRPGHYLDFPVVLDGKVLKYDPFDGDEGSEFWKDIPLIICHTKHDMGLLALFRPEWFELTEETLKDNLTEAGCDKAMRDRVIRTYSEMLDDPVSPSDIFIGLLNDNREITFIETASRAKEKVGGAPLYNCVFSFESPDPVQKAVHGTDVPFFFDNVHLAPGLYTAANKGAAYSVSDTCGSSWASFARTGDPTGRSMPEWLPYDQKNRFSMLFKAESELVSDYHREGRLILEDFKGNIPGIRRKEEE